MKKVLVLGAGGYFGSAVVKSLSERSEFEVICVYRGEGSSPGKSANSYFINALDYDAMLNVLALSRPDIVINLVGRIPGLIKNQNIALVKDNFMTALNLMEAADELNLMAKIVLVSSAAEYQIQSESTPLNENHNCVPAGIYGLSKNTMTRFAYFYREQRELDIVVARVFNVIGPGAGQDTVAGSVLKQLVQSQKDIVAKQDIQLGDLSAIRDFVDVRDMARALTHLGENKTQHLIYNLCSSKPTQVRSIIESLVEVSGLDVKLVEKIDLARSENPSFSLGDNSRLIDNGFDFSYSLKDSIRDMWLHEIA